MPTDSDVIVPTSETPANMPWRADLLALLVILAAALVVHHRLVVGVTLDEPGYLVVQDTWVPGWKARVDGAATTILPANVAARAVAFAAGTHRVEFD